MIPSSSHHSRLAVTTGGWAALYSGSLDGPQKDIVQLNWRRPGRRYSRKNLYRPKSPFRRYVVNVAWRE